MDQTIAMDAVTTEGSFVGTVAYASPEQAQGEAVDARSDVFSLGTMLYEMATGQQPFQGNNPMAVRSAILKDQPDLSAIPPRLVEIIGRCLEKDPDQRYRSANELQVDLAELQFEIDSSASELATAPKPRRSRWVIAPLLVVVAVLAWLLLREDAPQTPVDSTALSDVIVVFPFENLGSDKESYFAEGVSDEIMSRLSAITGIGVIAPTTAMQYDRTGKSRSSSGRSSIDGGAIESTRNPLPRSFFARSQMNPKNGNSSAPLHTACEAKLRRPIALSRLIGRRTRRGGTSSWNIVSCM